MSREAKKLAPRFGRQQAVPQTIIQVKGRGARHLAGAIPQAAPGTVPAPLAFRHRHKMVPVWWFLLVTLPALVMYLAHAVKAGLVAGLILGAVIALGCQGREKFRARAGAAAGFLTALWLPLLAAFGPKPSLALWAVCCAAVAVPWWHYYRIRGEEPEPEITGDALTWARLCEKMHWHAELGTVVKIRGGGRQYPISLDGVMTHIGELTSQPQRIAAAFGRPVTEAYAEPVPHGSQAEGLLTILKPGSLDVIGYWDGQGADEQGFATIGRYGDGSPWRVRLFAPSNGAKHGIFAGATGSGKSSGLDLLIRIMLASGIYPVILDPQNGQSLPQWRDRVPYASGPDQCIEMLRLLDEGMMNRSARLAEMTWDNHGRTVRGLPFFDHQLTGWPYVAGIFEEHPVLLTNPQYATEAIRLTANRGKLGRKTGDIMWLCAQLPSLAELGDQVVRSMAVSGNVIGLRTGDKVTGGMLMLPTDPSELPRFFPSGNETCGVGYGIGPDGRQGIGRLNVPTAAQSAADYVLPVLEPEYAAILARFGTGGSASAAPVPASAVPLAAVDDTPAPGGQTAADAILAVLTGPMERGDILNACKAKAAEWGREQPWVMRAVTGPLARMVEEGRIRRDPKPGTDGREGIYTPVRPSLTMIPGSPDVPAKPPAAATGGAS